MTDYRDFNQPGVHSAHRDAYAPSSSGSSTGGVLVALALIGLVILAASVFYSGPGNDVPALPTTDQTTTGPVAPAAPATDPTLSPIVPPPTQ